MAALPAVKKDKGVLIRSAEQDGQLHLLNHVSIKVYCIQFSPCACLHELQWVPPRPDLDVQR